RGIFEQVSGVKLKRFFDRYIHGTEDVPLAKLLAPFGVVLSDERKNAKPSLNVRTAKNGGDCRLTHVYEGGAAHQAGLSAGDVLVAVNGLRATASNLEELLGRYRVGDVVLVHSFRRDELMQFAVTLAADDTPKVVLATEDKPVAV